MKITKWIDEVYWWFSYTWMHRAYWWVRHRTTNRYHVIKTGLPPGWYDTDSILESVAWTLLVKYVEGECAPRWNHGERRHNKPELSVREAGLAWLKYQYTPSPGEDENPGWPGNPDYKEIETIYRWYTEDRVRRPDPYDNYVSKRDSISMQLGLRELDDDKESSWWDPIEVEEYYYEEDTDMLIRLIKIRRSLWT